MKKIKNFITYDKSTPAILSTGRNRSLLFWHNCKTTTTPIPYCWPYLKWHNFPSGATKYHIFALSFKNCTTNVRTKEGTFLPNWHKSKIIISGFVESFTSTTILYKNILNFYWWFSLAITTNLEHLMKNKLHWGSYMLEDIVLMAKSLNIFGSSVNYRLIREHWQKYLNMAHRWFCNTNELKMFRVFSVKHWFRSQRSSPILFVMTKTVLFWVSSFKTLTSSKS